MEGWVKMASSAVLGAAGAIVSITMWVGDKNYTIQAHELAIQRLQVTNNALYDTLQEINQKLSKIDGKIEVMLNGRR